MPCALFLVRYPTCLSLVRYPCPERWPFASQARPKPLIASERRGNRLDRLPSPPGFRGALPKSAPPETYSRSMPRALGWSVGRLHFWRLIDSCITQLEAQRPSRTCHESKEKEESILIMGELNEDFARVQSTVHFVKYPVDPPFGALSGRLESTVRRHTSNKESLLSNEDFVRVESTVRYGAVHSAVHGASGSMQK